MKFKHTAAALLCASLVLAAGCGTQPDSETAELTTKATENLTTESATEEPTTKATESPATEPATEEPTEEQTTAEVTTPADDRVFTAIDESFDNYVFRIPNFAIEGGDIASVNAEIMSKYDDIIKGIQNAKNEGKPMSYSRIDYEYYINGDIFSLIIKNHYSFNYLDYYVTNVSASTGEYLDNKKLSDALGLDYNEMLQKTKSALEADFIDRYGEKNTSKVTEYDKRLEQTLEDANVEESKFYIGSDGKLKVCCRQYSLIGASYYYRMIDIE